ncbi:Hypothetical predicted protein [Octopus vulgaris]|uniref:Uncharacterized protein n=1 Tax=Octopus vulgaris TaxID=6645 RepID=A0AA36F531_OCTVU|nr:Hypothetical predicted protein [Octopus vulgaris]
MSTPIWTTSTQLNYESVSKSRLELANRRKYQVSQSEVIEKEVSWWELDNFADPLVHKRCREIPGRLTDIPHECQSH